MEATITITRSAKNEIYEELIPQIRSLVKDEMNSLSNLANISAALKMAFEDFSWVGFYLLDNNELVVGPFQGKPACSRLQLGKGVCGTAAAEKRTVIVDDVTKFSGHIYCDPDSRSEIVVPLLIGDELRGVLDVDSYRPSNFDKTDARYLQEIAQITIDSMYHRQP